MKSRTRSEAGSVSVRAEGPDWIDRCRAEWTELIADSSADPLFMAWDWQQLWWKHFGKPSGAELVILVARDASHRLVGLAPFVARRTAARRVRPAVQLSPLGNVWRIGIGEVTEHIDWVIRRDHESDVCSAFTDALCHDVGWDEILCAYAREDSLIVGALRDLADQLRCLTRRDPPMPYYTIDLTNDFDQYLKKLSAHSRRRMYARRALLERLGAVKMKHTDAQTIEQQLDRLDQLSRKRWATGLQPAFRKFYAELSERSLEQGNLAFSILAVDERPISGQFDILAGRGRYNIRSAIDTSFDRRISPGLLHLGWCVEAGCAASGVDRYELLAGEGKRTDFKREISREAGEFASLQVVRRPDEKLAYRLYDGLRARLGRAGP